MTNTTDAALNLMQMALAILDNHGEGGGVTACHLQTAIEFQEAAMEDLEPLALAG